jgi:DNA-binding MarR family transcriptional regulator
MAELAERVVLSRSGLTRLVERLEKQGLVYREHCTGDRRGTEAVLTQEGLEALRSAWPVYAQGIKEHFARCLNEDEAQLIAGALGRVADSVPLVKEQG